MTKAERLDMRSKVKSGVHIVFAPLNARKVRAWLKEENGMKFVFINEKLSKRQRGGEIRRGIRFHRKREAKR